MMKITNLTTEQLKDPTGLDTLSPRFSWQVEEFSAGASQAAYRIEVASEKELLESADMWNSGIVASPVLSMIPYGGKKLESLRGYFWRVTVTDTFGNTAVSEPASFGMGMVEPDTWTAGWITSPTYQKNVASMFRKDFTVKPGLRRAVALVCGLGYNEVSVNGKKQGSSVLDPGWTTFDKRAQYVGHDITSSLQEGVNTIGVVLGEGWYNNDHEVFRQFSFLKPLTWLGQLRLSAQIFLEYEDGCELLLTGENEGWTAGDGPIVYNDVFNGEHYDATKEITGWDTPAATGTQGWKPAIAIEGPGGALEPEVAEPIRVIRDIAPVKLTEPKPGVFVYDMGQNFAGWVQLRVTAPRGTEISIKFAEMLYEDGTINQENLRWAKNHDIYIAKGEGEEVFEPHFTYHGFRYVQLTGITPTMETIMGRQVRSAVSQTGDFSCGNALLNKIQRCVLWTEESNLHSVPTDCPQRDERQGWVNDCTVRIEEIIYNFGVAAFMRKWQKDLADTQDPDGAIKDVAPRAFGADKADPLSSIFLFVPWFNRLFYADDRIIPEQYDHLCAWQAYLTTRSHFGIMQYYNYGDWAGPVDGGVGGREANSALSAITPGEFVSTIFYYQNAAMLSEMAKIIGRTEDVEKYRQQAEYIKASINREYFNYETAQYALGSQASNVLALHFDIVPQEYRQRVLNNLTADIAAHDYHLTTGNIATKYLFEVLSDNGLVDVAFAIATQEDYPSWGYMFANGATTIWERWELGTTCEMNSHNHPMYGTISTWFFKHLAGISPLEPGFKKLRIAPKLPQKLDHAEGKLETVLGEVVSKWEKTESGLKMELSVPFGAEAIVEIPQEYSQALSCNGQEISAAQAGVVSVERTGDGAFVLALSSGQFSLLAQ